MVNSICDLLFEGYSVKLIDLSNFDFVPRGGVGAWIQARPPGFMWLPEVVVLAHSLPLLGWWFRRP